MVEHFRAHPDIRARARDIVFRLWRQLPREQRGQALALGEWVQGQIRYVAEMPETFQTPVTTIAEGYGDCDDMTTLIASLCESIGIGTELVGLEWKTTNPQTLGEYLKWLGFRSDLVGAEDFRHIFCRAVLPSGARLPLDASLTYPVRDAACPVALAGRLGIPVSIYVA